MRRALPFAILGACLVVGVLPALAADQSVAIHDFRYAPGAVAVKPGETVTWRADGAYMHNVHFDGETAALGPPSAKYTASRTFPDEGRFAYHCDVHASMHGVVYVNPTGTVPAPPATPTPTPTGTAGSPTPTPFLHARRGRVRAGLLLPREGVGPQAQGLPHAHGQRQQGPAGARDAEAREQARAPASACSHAPGATSSACRASG